MGMEVNQYPKGNWRCHLCKFGTPCLEKRHKHVCTAKHKCALHKMMLKTGILPVFRLRQPAVPSVPIPQSCPALDTTVPVAPTDQDSDRLTPSNSLKSTAQFDSAPICSDSSPRRTMTGNQFIRKQPAGKDARRIRCAKHKTKHKKRVKKKVHKKRVKKARSDSKRAAPGLETDSERITPDSDVIASDLKQLYQTFCHKRQVRPSLREERYHGGN